MKKILWIGSYLIPSGFSKVNRSIIKHLAHKYDITFVDYDKTYKDAITQFEGIKLTGTNGPNDLYAFKKLQQMDFNSFDIIFILNDPWGLTQFLHILKQRSSKAKVVCYFPVDATGHYKHWYDSFDIVDVPVTYTQFGYNEVLSVAPQLKDRLKIIPHGIDTDIFYKIDVPKAELREKYFKTDKYNDAVIFLNANRNQPRKRLDITVKAFAEFMKLNEKPNAYLLMHCGNTDLHSMDIGRLAERYDVTDRVMLSSGGGTSGIKKLSNEMMNVIYNMCDFGLNSSMAEGWGLCNTEHAATGALQIVPNHSACAELHDSQLLISIVCDYTLDEIMTIGKIPSAKHMTALMKIVYDLRKNYPDDLKKHSEEIIGKFTAPKYQWKNIAAQWDEIFAAL